MKIRLVILLALLAAAAGLSFRPEWSGKAERLNQRFLDFLNANTRGHYDKEDLTPASDVVFVEFREADKAEFSAWPPAPLDYIMVLKRLAEHDPDLVAFTNVLGWEQKDVQFLGELQQSFLKFPSVVLAFDAQDIGRETVDSAIHEDLNLPKIARVEGDASLAPRLGKYEFPSKSLRAQMELGFVLEDKKDAGSVPLVARTGETLAPSLAAQLLALREHAPYASQRLRFGRGAGLYLGDTLYVPLADDGTVTPRLNGDFTRVSALDLLTPSLEDAASREAGTRLGAHKIFILGTTPSAGEAQARAVAWALALPRLHRAPLLVEWIAAGVMGFLLLWQLRLRRFGALVFGGGMLALALAVSLMVFQTSQWWCAAALPAAFLAVSTIFCFLWPRGRQTAPAEAVAPTVETAA